jgi:hypothetical protein
VDLDGRLGGVVTDKVHDVARFGESLSRRFKGKSAGNPGDVSYRRDPSTTMPKTSILRREVASSYSNY